MPLPRNTQVIADRPLRNRASHKAAPKCSCYDSDCNFVASPSRCWIGDCNTGPADGYCPLMLSKEVTK